MTSARAFPRIFASSASALRSPASQRTILRQTFQRRAQSTASDAAQNAQNAAKTAESGFGKFWNSPVGPKTVHFWAPIMKWGLVLAGISDFARPAESLSLSQNAALMATGLIWTRWCFIIKPRNLFLAAVNFFLFCVGTTQSIRVLLYRQSLQAAAEPDAKAAEKIVKDPKGAAEDATKA